MTGLFGRVRAWIGSLFGTAESAAADDGDEGSEAAEGREPTAAEGEFEGATTRANTGATDAGATGTESTAAEPTPDATSTDVTAEALAKAIEEAESTPTTRTVRRETPSDDDTAAASPFELEGGPKTVRVPSETTPEDAPTDATADDTTGDDATADDTTGDDATADDTTGDDATADDSAPTAYDYRCTVCGTGVETPDDPCPLCHSAEIVPTDDAGDVYDGTDAGGGGDTAAGPIGETTTSISDADDAVERLRDLRQDEE